MHKIKAVIFDMDGVLIEAKDWHYEALNRALKLFGMEISYAEHLTTFDGLPTKKKLEILSIDRNLPKGLSVSRLRLNLLRMPQPVSRYLQRMPLWEMPYSRRCLRSWMS